MTNTQQELIEQIEGLKLALVGEMFADMNLLDEIHRLEMILNGTKPEDTSVDCEGCGS
jgi:hypothetical protein